MDAGGGIPVENRARMKRRAFNALAASLRGQRSLRIALPWLLSHDPPLAPSAAVAQDEYTHDIVVPYAKGLFLTYDST